jgi:DNA-binding response OmpR family regulator
MSTRRILVIDDSNLILALAQLGLQGQAGWEVLTASSGRAGLKQAAAERPDAVLLDLVMPDLDGAATLQALRQADATREIPVILLTGREPASELPADGVIVKPFDPGTLAGQVAAKLGWSL